MSADPTPLRAHQQLTFDVKPHPRDVQHAKALDREPWLEGSIAIKGAMRVDRNFHAGDELTVTVHDADGEVVATGECEVGMPAFKQIKIKGDPVGTERAHTAKIVG